MTPFPSCQTFVLMAAAILFMSDFGFTRKHTFNLKIKYFTNGNMLCDHPELDIIKRNDIQSLAWVFPDGSVVTPSTYLDPRKYILQGLADGVTPSSQPASTYGGYNLTVLEVDDDEFGYYTCVVVFSTGGGNSQPIDAVRWGLNVDGADFSDLLDDYRHNAIVGGIAAGAMLVLIGICCLVWYKCNNEQLPEDLDENDAEGGEITKKKGMAMYQNDGFKGEKSGNENDTNTNNENDNQGNSRL